MAIGQLIPVNPIAPAFAPTAWDGAQFYAGGFPSLTVTVTTAPTGAYTPQWSADGVNWSSITVFDKNLNPLTSIATSFSGPFDMDGNGYVRLNGGTGGAILLSGGQ